MVSRHTTDDLSPITYHPSPITPSSRWRRLRRSELLPGLLFISPWIIGFAWFQLYPILASIRYSFTNYNMMQPPLDVGLENYTRLLTADEAFRKALTNTAIYALVSVPLNLI